MGTYSNMEERTARRYLRFIGGKERDFFYFIVCMISSKFRRNLFSYYMRLLYATLCPCLSVCLCLSLSFLSTLVYPYLSLSICPSNCIRYTVKRIMLTYNSISKLIKSRIKINIITGNAKLKKN